MLIPLVEKLALTSAALGLPLSSPAGDVMILKSDATLKHVKDFTAQIQTLDIPGEVKAGYSPIGFVRCGRAACRITKINWKVRGCLGLLRPVSRPARDAGQRAAQQQRGIRGR